MNFAMAAGWSLTNLQSIKSWIPLSGFLLKTFKATLYILLRFCSAVSFLLKDISWWLWQYGNMQGFWEVEAGWPLISVEEEEEVVLFCWWLSLVDRTSFMSIVLKRKGIKLLLPYKIAKYRKNYGNEMMSNPPARITHTRANLCFKREAPPTMSSVGIDIDSRARLIDGAKFHRGARNTSNVRRWMKSKRIAKDDKHS